MVKDWRTIQLSQDLEVVSESHVMGVKKYQRVGLASALPSGLECLPGDQLGEVEERGSVLRGTVRIGDEHRRIADVPDHHKQRRIDRVGAGILRHSRLQQALCPRHRKLSPHDIRREAGGDIRQR